MPSLPNAQPGDESGLQAGSPHATVGLNGPLLEQSRRFLALREMSPIDAKADTPHPGPDGLSSANFGRSPLLTGLVVWKLNFSVTKFQRRRST